MNHTYDYEWKVSAGIEIARTQINLGHPDSFMAAKCAARVVSPRDKETREVLSLVIFQEICSQEDASRPGRTPHFRAGRGISLLS